LFRFKHREHEQKFDGHAAHQTFVRHIIIESIKLALLKYVAHPNGVDTVIVDILQVGNVEAEVLSIPLVHIIKI
jgi:hypothetical protein